MLYPNASQVKLYKSEMVAQELHALRVAESKAEADALAFETIQHASKRTMLESIFWLTKAQHCTHDTIPYPSQYAIPYPSAHA